MHTLKKGCHCKEGLARHLFKLALRLDLQLTLRPWDLGPPWARDLQLTPGPRDLLASAGQGAPPAYSRAPGPPS